MERLQSARKLLVIIARFSLEDVSVAFYFDASMLCIRWHVYWWRNTCAFFFQLYLPIQECSDYLNRIVREGPRAEEWSRQQADSVEEALAFGWDKKEAGQRCPRLVAQKGYSVWVASKRTDVLLDPSEGEADVAQADGRLVTTRPRPQESWKNKINRPINTFRVKTILYLHFETKFLYIAKNHFYISLLLSMSLTESYIKTLMSLPGLT